MGSIIGSWSQPVEKRGVSLSVKSNGGYITARKHVGQDAGESLILLTVTHFCQWWYWKVEVVKKIDGLVCFYGAQVEIPGSMIAKRSMFMKSVMNMRSDAAMALLLLGKDPDMTYDPWRKSAFVYAAEHNLIDIVLDVQSKIFHLGNSGTRIFLRYQTGVMVANRLSRR